MSDAHAVARDQLRSFIERIERLEEEKKTIADDIKDVKAEAKGCGFDVSIINAIIKLRKKDAAEREEEAAVLDTYMIALGMLPEPFEAETGEVLDSDDYTIIDRDDEDGNHLTVTVDARIAAILAKNKKSVAAPSADATAPVSSQTAVAEDAGSPDGILTHSISNTEVAA
jgi:uncharacterized protein (UPF0335 family)